MTAPRYVHATAHVDIRPDDLVRSLHDHLAELVAAATGQTLRTLHELIADGGFRRPPAPRTRAAVLTDGPAVARISWNAHDVPLWPPDLPFARRPTSRFWLEEEESTGWPSIVYELAVSPTPSPRAGLPGGSLLVLSSSRPPGVDTSRNRVDGVVRDRIVRAAGPALLDALAAGLRRHALAPVGGR